MRTKKVITPNFYSRFQCVGTDCINHCCGAWNITIDKKSYKKYLHSDFEEIREFAQQDIIKMSKHDSTLMVKKNAQGNCPMLSPKGLCSVHARMGAQALSVTCKTYPRLAKDFFNETRHSLTLSCPEAARQLLFYQDSVQYQEQEQLVHENYQINRFAKQKTLTTRNKLINLACLNLILLESPAIENNLFSMMKLVIFLQQLETQQMAESERFHQIESFYHVLANELLDNQSPLIQTTLSDESFNFKKYVLTILGKYMKQQSRYGQQLSENHLLIAQHLKTDSQEQRIQSLQQLQQYWEQLNTTTLFKHPVMRNILFYHIYNRCFPAGNIQHIQQQFYRLLVDFFYLKTVLSVRAGIAPISEKDLIILVSSYHSHLEHRSDADEILQGYFAEIGKDVNSFMLVSCMLIN